MRKTLFITIILLIISCTGKNKIEAPENNSEENVVTSNEEKKYQTIVDSLKTFKIKPIDSITIEYDISQNKNYRLRNSKIEIFKKDSLNIDWIKINSNKIEIAKLKTINPRVDGKQENMFCQSLEKIKFYKFKNEEILFLQFVSSPCTGLGCSVTDYLIYNLNKKQINLFGNFRAADMDLYSFPINSEINYIATEYQGDFHGNTPVHFISRIYSMRKNGEFQLTKDKNDSEYYFEVISYPKNSQKQIEYKSNWF